MPALYVVATPIGNLEDISLRALRVLREVKLIAAEDTRKTRRLLARYDIRTPMTSYYEHNKLAKLDYILNCLQNEDVALVSEAGMPGISDPGYELIGEASRRGIPVIPIPGPSVITTALVVSGLPTDRFLFIGFLPHRASARRRVLESVAEEVGTIVAFESPHRFVDALEDVRQVLGERRMAVCRELTKVHEEVFRGTVSEALERFADPRGEFTLIIEGRKESEPPPIDSVEKELRRLQSDGASAREAISRLSVQTGRSKRELYRLWLRLNTIADARVSLRQANRGVN